MRSTTLSDPRAMLSRLTRLGRRITTAMKRSNQEASGIAEANVLVSAPQQRIWRLHTKVGKWDTWIPEIAPARKRTPGPLRPGSFLDWSQGMQVTSTVTKVHRSVRAVVDKIAMHRGPAGFELRDAARR